MITNEKKEAVAFSQWSDSLSAIPRNPSGSWMNYCELYDYFFQLKNELGQSVRDIYLKHAIKMEDFSK